MSRRPLAARFDRFDDDDEARRQAAYLDAQAATDFWRERKRLSFALLGLRPGMAALDVGCGTGDDVRAMAALVALGGEAAGVDGSRGLIAEARRRSAGGGAGVTFHLADAAALPFPGDRFDAVRFERVLQHVEDPSAVLAEAVRVARSGAALVAIEPDWESLEIAGNPAEAGRAVGRRWASAIRRPRVGRELTRLLERAGCTAVDAREDASLITDLAFAEEQLALSELARAAAGYGELSADQAEGWLADLRARDAAGRFRARVTYVTATAVVP